MMGDALRFLCNLFDVQKSFPYCVSHQADGISAGITWLFTDCP